MVETSLKVDHFTDYLKGIMSDEIITRWKRDYNRLASKAIRGEKYLDSENISSAEKNKVFLNYFLEILEPLERYIEVFRSLGIEMPSDLFAGFPDVK